jgi:hypothetical protein
MTLLFRILDSAFIVGLTFFLWWGGDVDQIDRETAWFIGMVAAMVATWNVDYND